MPCSTRTSRTAGFPAISNWLRQSRARTREMVTLTPDGARRKAAAIACYAGEVPRLEGLQARLERAVEEFLFEVFWRGSESPAVD